METKLINRFYFHCRIHYTCLLIICLHADEYSISAHHLLNCLCVTGPIPIPLFLIEELDNIITKAVSGKNNGMQSSVTPLTKQLEIEVLRNYSHVFLYHKDFNPEFQVATSKLMYIPSFFVMSSTLICIVEMLLYQLLMSSKQ